MVVTIVRVNKEWVSIDVSCSWIASNMSASISESIPCSSGVEVRQASVGQYDLSEATVVGVVFSLQAVIPNSMASSPNRDKIFLDFIAFAFLDGA